MKVRTHLYVWSDVFHFGFRADRAKCRVEDNHRKLRKEREATDEKFVPKYFVLDEANQRWCDERVCVVTVCVCVCVCVCVRATVNLSCVMTDVMHGRLAAPNALAFEPPKPGPFGNGFVVFLLACSFLTRIVCIRHHQWHGHDDGSVR